MERDLLIRRLSVSPHNLRFEEFVHIIEAFGFRLLRVRGSHHMFRHPALPTLVNIQSRRGRAKAYQVRDFVKLVERYNLAVKDGGG